MSENGQEKAIVVNRGTLLNLNGTEYRIPLVDLVCEFDKLSKQLEADGKTHEDYLVEMRKRLQERYGMDLALDDTDTLNDEMRIALAEIKKKRKVAFASTQQ